ncbi:hypothetical protein CQ017_15525 [Arthrobacter sp. MYb224]|uniref:hypothetical protein n=1 Tax=Arthrobacter sp. MYb224 TaxID=1848600 RepID=UPI000CFB9625|nr:hypothetical protein [Arthrobacter sp. MYb224]PQZ97031.1 hypothetical protein CQ017_15525 [Arthrobacter sp. MYb224]
MSNTLERQKNSKPARTRWLLAILGALLVVALATWLIINALGGSGPQGQDAGNEPEGGGAVAAGEAEDQGPAEPITTFEGATSGDWPDAPQDSVGCGYVAERLGTINQDVQLQGVDAIRGWLDAIDDLQGDPSVTEHSQQFDAVKRSWSTVLAMEADEEQDGEKQLEEAEQSLEVLIKSVECN